MQLHADLATLAREGVTHLAIEASSHGLDQHRLDGLELSAAAFTNLTHEHLDYHPTMDAYFAAKARLFETLLPASGTAVVNADSDRAAQLGEICARRGVRFWTYGAKGRELRLLRDEPTPPASIWSSRCWAARHEVELPLVGGFQASNALAALGLVVATGGDAGARGGGAGDAERRAGPAAARGAPQDGRAGLCRLRPQARGAGDGAGDPAAVRQGQAGRGVRLRRRPRPRQAAGDGRDRHAPRRPHPGHRRQSAQRGARRDPRRDRARHPGRAEELDRGPRPIAMPPSSRAWRRSARPTTCC